MPKSKIVALVLAFIAVMLLTGLDVPGVSVVKTLVVVAVLAVVAFFTWKWEVDDYHNKFRRERQRAHR